MKHIGLLSPGVQRTTVWPSWNYQLPSSDPCWLMNSLGVRLPFIYILYIYIKGIIIIHVPRNPMNQSVQWNGRGYWTLLSWFSLDPIEEGWALAFEGGGILLHVHLYTSESIPCWSMKHVSESRLSSIEVFLRMVWGNQQCSHMLLAPTL